MRISMNKILLLICSFILTVSVVLPVSASDSSGSKYRAVIIDNADLFTDEEENQLQKLMEESIAYGNMFLYTTNENQYADTYTMTDIEYISVFGLQEGVAFVIDMDERMLWLSGEEDMEYTLTQDYCRTITDNMYTYASAGKYFDCAKACFSQVNRLLVGKYVPKPMKHICYFLLSILLALVLNFFIAMSQSKKSKPSRSAWTSNMINRCNITNTRVNFVRESRRHIPRDSGSSGHHSSGGSHHSSGGSHHSSGGSHHSSSHHSSGGGHRF